jgi:catechol 2,3-dioxygenase-like lactoylglutathione lyase family enzyme
MRATFLLAVCAACAQPMPEARFHHLHLNVTDPEAAISFYTSKFDCEKARFAGVEDAVWAQKSWLLFDKVAQPPPSEILSAIWHFGWGAEDMKAAYKKQLDSGTLFDTPITELFPGFFYAYVIGPNKALIELNTAKHHNFGHLHLLSADAVSAGHWYQKYFGAKWASGRPPTREPRFIRGYQIGPSSSLLADNVNIIIFPIEYARQQWPENWTKERTAFVSPKGRVVDHVAFSFEKLDEALAIFEKDGVKVVARPAEIPGTKVRSAFIEGPDNILLELVEGHPRKE